ncbi:MAG: alkaline phosphatase D family protein [Alphaproteobacteria bacterium]|nr:alkaline phosphatase D family protein [Alphaproteobacteria bacterium]
MSFRRRSLFRAVAAPAVLSLAGCAAGRFGGRDPFSLGVASGYPRADGVVLWTRLAPEPLAADGSGGMSPEPAAVGWEIAEDAGFTRGVRRGAVRTSARWGHSVHVEVDGLTPARPHWYRFIVDGVASPIGRTRTAPAAGAPVDRLRFAYASCQQFEQGWYTAHRHMAAEDLDLVVFLGDYIYESSWGNLHVRKHEAGEPETLAQYRNRYACYRGDRDLQACHAAFPWVVTWDDHEVDNDYANDRSEQLAPREAFLARRAAAYQAFYEHMPLPAAMRPSGPDMKIYTRFDWGALARMHVLDDRQYRSHQVCARAGRGGSTVVDERCTERLDPALTLLGETQERWLADGFRATPTPWTVIAQQSVMATVQRPDAQGRKRWWTDAWDGYPAARGRLLGALERNRVRNPVVIGGDVHACYVADLLADFEKPRGAVIASEICGTSITSQGPGPAATDAQLAANPHLKFANGTARGYVAMTIMPKLAEAALRVVETVKQPGAAIRTAARFAIEDGRPGPQIATS